MTTIYKTQWEKIEREINNGNNERAQYYLCSAESNAWDSLSETEQEIIRQTDQFSEEYYISAIVTFELWFDEQGQN